MTFARLPRALLFVAVFAASSCVAPSMRRLGDELVTRPPPWVFGVAWSLLAVSTATAWALAPAEGTPLVVVDVCFVALLLSFVWFNLKATTLSALGKMWSVLASVLFALGAYSLSAWSGRLLLSPLLVWLLFAFSMHQHVVCATCTAERPPMEA